MALAYASCVPDEDRRSVYPVGMARALLISKTLAVGLLLAGCGPMSVGLTAASLLMGGGGDPNAAAPVATPRADLMQALQVVDTHATASCNAQVDEILVANKDEFAEQSCRVQPVCLGGSSQPVPMMVCSEIPLQTGPATQRVSDDPAAWDWK